MLSWHGDRHWLVTGIQGKELGSSATSGCPLHRQQDASQSCIWGFSPLESQRAVCSDQGSRTFPSPSARPCTSGTAQHGDAWDAGAGEGTQGSGSHAVPSGQDSALSPALFLCLHNCGKQIPTPKNVWEAWEERGAVSNSGPLKTRPSWNEEKNMVLILEIRPGTV